MLTLEGVPHTRGEDMRGSRTGSKAKTEAWDQPPSVCQASTWTPLLL